ncbi:MAG: hypothetical protein JKY46_04270 [Robiginitomaculum sp.]|nr:hypothetical protein [Robiginitomaculum sp.]
MSEIIQKKFFNTIKFDFGAESFKYYHKDNQTEEQFRIAYTSVPNDRSTFTDKNLWLRNVGFIWCLLGVIILGLGAADGSLSIADGLWLLLGAICLVVFKYSQVKYTIFRTAKGNVLVLQNDDHDKIVQEIFNHRREQFLMVYGDINSENDINEEIGKFKWLRDEGVITDNEFDKKIKIIQLANVNPETDKRVN